MVETVEAAQEAGGAGATMVLRVAYDGTDFSGYAIQEKQGHVRTVAGELRDALRMLLRRDVDLTCAGRTDAGVHARAQHVSFAVEQGHVRTVAGELRDALRMLLRRDVDLTCAGRTDAGVHARAQHVSFAVDEREASELDGSRLLRSLGAVLPEDVRVDRVLRAPAGFSARFDAQARHYRYEASELDGSRLLRSLGAVLPEDVRVDRVLRAPAGFSARFDAQARHYRYGVSVGPVEPLFGARWTWWQRSAVPWDIDVDAMAEGARYLEGEHDFKSFCKTASAVDKPTCRFVEHVRLEWEEAFGERRLVFDVVGNAFLHSMVRTIVGTLMEVGCGRRSPAWVGEVLAACDRRAAGPCAPAKGLTFWDVQYPGGVLLPW